VLQVGSTLFVHGGVLPAHVEYGLERINRETRAWLLGQDPASASSSSSSDSASSSRSPDSSSKRYPPPAFLRGADAVVWARNFSAREEARCDCDTLQEVLGALPGARRMVVSRVNRRSVGLVQGCKGRARLSAAQSVP
jgi:hypothetical protein